MGAGVGAHARGVYFHFPFLAWSTWVQWSEECDYQTGTRTSSRNCVETGLQGNQDSIEAHTCGPDWSKTMLCDSGKHITSKVFLQQSVPGDKLVLIHFFICSETAIPEQ